VSNKHQVPLETIENKLNKYQIIMPRYFGLFLNESDTNLFTRTAYDALEQALCEFSVFKANLKSKPGRLWLAFINSNILHK
jgi:hypothetical protein